LTQHHHVGEVDVGACTWSSPCGRTCVDWFGNSSMFLHLPWGLQRSQAKQNNTQRLYGMSSWVEGGHLTKLLMWSCCRSV
jgi:hypothetical protein